LDAARHVVTNCRTAGKDQTFIWEILKSVIQILAAKTFLVNSGEAKGFSNPVIYGTQGLF
jgi:hypothetical protein